MPGNGGGPCLRCLPARVRFTECPNLPPHKRAHHQVQFGSEICLVRGRSLWMSPYHKQATSRQRWQVPTHQRTQAPPHLVPHHCVADRLAHHEAARRGLVLVTGADQQITGQQGTARPAAAAHGKLRSRPAAASGIPREARPTSPAEAPLVMKPGAPGSHADPGPALPPPCGQDRPSCPGPHTQPESVRLGTASVVRLERALAHWWLQIRCQHPQSGHRARKSATDCPGTTVGGKLKSVNGTRSGDHRSNQRLTSGYLRCLDPVPAFG